MPASSPRIAQPAFAAAAAVPPRYAPDVAPPASLGRLVTGGTIGWVAGLAAGLATARVMVPNAREGYLGPGEWWLGAAIGSSVGSAVGAHIADRGEGSLVLSAAASLVALPAGLLLAVPLASGGEAGLLTIPAAQIGAGVLVERATRDARRRRVEAQRGR